MLAHGSQQRRARLPAARARHAAQWGEEDEDDVQAGDVQTRDDLDTDAYLDSCFASRYVSKPIPKKRRASCTGHSARAWANVALAHAPRRALSRPPRPHPPTIPPAAARRAQAP